MTRTRTTGPPPPLPPPLKTNVSAHTLFMRNYLTQLARTNIPTFTHKPSAKTRSVRSSVQHGVEDNVSSLMQQVQFSLVTYYFLH